MKTVVVVYGAPENPVEFERHYRDVHVPLVKKMPNLVGFEASISPSTDARQWHAIALLKYANQAALDQSMASAEGVAAVEDVATFATGGCSIYTCEFESF
ncbi:EthD family reductase [Pseudomonas sp. LRF_L74]|uniref:EthD family reductase n=1 Tax=Pseudomonas sp. LRF_L74 TaxID=3369422 RepID=UPI003F612672